MANEVSTAGKKNEVLTEKAALYLMSEGAKTQIAKVIGGENSDRFISSLMSAVQTNKKLNDCTGKSLVNAALLGFTLKLSPSPQLGQFYMVPYSGEAQFQLGYKGMLQLAMRSGQYRKIVAIPIKEGELKRYDPLTEEMEVELIKDPDAREKAEAIGYYAMFEYLNGFRKAIYWSKAKVEAHRKRFSKSKDVWNSNYEAMALKTVLKNLLGRWGIMSIDMETAFQADQAVMREYGSYAYVDNPAGSLLPPIESDDEPTPIDIPADAVKISVAEKKETAPAAPAADEEAGF